MKKFDRLFVTFSVIMTVYTSYIGGFAAAHHHYADMGLDLIIGAFWLITGLFVFTNHLLDIQLESLDREHEHLHKLAELFKELAEQHESELQTEQAKAKPAKKTAKTETTIKV